MDSKVLTVVVDALASVVVLLATRFVSPNDAQLVKELILAIQPAVIVLIGAITYKEKAEIEAKSLVDEAAVAYSRGK